MKLMLKKKKDDVNFREHTCLYFILIMTMNCSPNGYYADKEILQITRNEYLMAVLKTVNYGQHFFILLEFC